MAGGAQPARLTQSWRRSCLATSSVLSLPFSHPSRLVSSESLPSYVLGPRTFPPWCVRLTHGPDAPRDQRSSTSSPSTGILRHVAETAWRNKLYYGDNLDVMRENIAPGSIHLVYLDPESDRTGVGESGQQEAG